MKVKKAIVVTGMHRSGTSALTRAISFFGYELPQDLMKAQADNPKGHWEPQGIVRLNNEILSALKAEWDRPGPFLVPGLSIEDSRKAVIDAVVSRYVDDAADAIISSYGNAERIVLKDPRLTIFWPLWERALADTGYYPKLVHIFRNPLEVADSLRARNQFGIFKVLRLWLLYNLRVLGLYEGNNLASVVDYSALLDDPELVVRQVLAAVGIDNQADDAAFGQLADFISASERHHKANAADVETMPTVATPVRDLFRLLCNWDDTPVSDRVKTVTDMTNQFSDIALLSGMVIGANISSLKAPVVRSGREAASGRRNVIVHYHLFKNAGTSLDAVLQWNFGKAWVQQEFVETDRKALRLNAHSNHEAVGAFIADNPRLQAMSSHTALLPVPNVENTDIFSIMFIRHPIDRLRSSYQFERRQDADTFGANLAKTTDLAGYLRTLLDHKSHRAARNFQAFRLALNEEASAGSELKRARRALDRLSFVGLVESFSDSLRKLEGLLRKNFHDFSAYEFRRNVTQLDSSSLEARLAAVRTEIGENLYDELIVANSDDMKIFEIVANSYQYTTREYVA